MDGDAMQATASEAKKQVQHHLDRAQDAAGKMHGPVAAKVRTLILQAALELTNYS